MTGTPALRSSSSRVAWGPVRSTIASTIRPEDLGRVLDGLAAAELHVLRPRARGSCRPSRAMPLANETRVRVEGRSKISATTRPASSGGQPEARSAFSRSARSRIAATASGGWCRSVSSERPATAGCGAKAADDMAAQSTSRPAVPSEPATRVARHQRPAGVADLKRRGHRGGGVGRGRLGRPSPDRPPRRGDRPPRAPGARRRHLGLAPLRAARCASRCRSAGSRGMATRRLRGGAHGRARLGPPRHRRRGPGDRHRGVRGRPGWPWARATGPAPSTSSAWRACRSRTASPGSTTTPSSPTRSRASAAAPSATSLPLSLVLIDLDRFKDFNDRYGHDAGNRMLAAVGEAIRLQHPRHRHAGALRRGGVRAHRARAVRRGDGGRRARARRRGRACA